MRKSTLEECFVQMLKATSTQMKRQGVELWPLTPTAEFANAVMMNGLAIFGSHSPLFKFILKEKKINFLSEVHVVHLFQPCGGDIWSVSMVHRPIQ